MVAVASCSTSTDVTPSISCTEVKKWLQKTPVQSGETWFVICARWFSNFIGQFDELNDTQYSPKKCGDLSPIDNSDLLDDKGVIRRGLILDMDYRIIPQDCWERLVREYKIKSGQDPLPVSIIQEGDALGPELYCCQVTMRDKFSRKEVVKSVSRTTTLREIESMMRKEFAFPPGGEARLELQPMADCEWVHIEDKSVCLMDTGATDAPIIVIDVPSRNAVAIPNGYHTYYGTDDGIRVYPAPSNGTVSPVDSSNMNDNPPLDDNGIPSSQHSSMASPQSLAMSPAASPSELLDRVIGEDEAACSAIPDDGAIVNCGDSGISSIPSTGPCDTAPGPIPQPEQSEDDPDAGFDILGLNDSKTAKAPITVESTEPVVGTSSAIPLPYEPLHAGTSTSGSAAIPLPYGPVNQGDVGGIALPYGPATQAESSALCALVEEEPTEPGVCGLRNLVNTCYMNSALQCLSNVKPLTEFFRSGEYEKDINVENSFGMQGNFARAYAGLLEKMWSGRYKSLSPSEMKDMVGKKDKQFLGSRQHDSQELMAAVLDGLHEDLKRPSAPPTETPTVNEAVENRCVEDIAEEAKRNHRLRLNSRIVDLVYGNQKSTVVCNNCGNVKITFDPFNVLSLPLPGGNLCRLYVTIFKLSQPEEKPVQHTVEVVNTGTISHLLQKVSTLTGIPASRLWAAEICNYQVNQPLPPSMSILSAIDLFSINIYERPPPPKLDDSDAMEECSMVETEPDNSNNTDHVEELVDGVQPAVIQMVDNSYNLPFGQPAVFFPTNCPSSVSVEELRQYILRQGCRYINAPKEGEESERWWEDPASASLPMPATIPSTASTESDLPQSSEEPMEQTEPQVVEPPPLFVFSQVNEDGTRTDLAEDAFISLPGDKVVHLVATWQRRARTKFYRDSEANARCHASATALSTATPSCSLAQCLDLLTSEDLLEGTNAVECPKCPKTEEGHTARCPAKKKIDLWDLPPVLILHLKRFMYMTHTSKLEVPVEFPISDLRLDQWVKGPQSPDIYDLVAVSNHSSHYMDRGHYTSFAKNWQNGKWYRFDDDYVTETEPILDGELAYILVYVRRDEEATLTNGEDMDIA